MRHLKAAVFVLCAVLAGGGLALADLSTVPQSPSVSYLATQFCRLTGCTFTGAVSAPSIGLTGTRFAVPGLWNTAGYSAATPGKVGYIRPMGQPYTITHASAWVVTSAGTGSMVTTWTDGTSTCTCTQACGSTGLFDVACVDGAGTGCAYTGALAVTGTITTQCTTAANVIVSYNAWIELR